jgi:hypothetical protein
MESVPAQLAVLAATVERLADENRALRSELATTQHQLILVAWVSWRHCLAALARSWPR